ncbi:hypothetical protein CEXT_107421 [Caerostris extrusa]|uniref:Uncharacterized protein n=1 Tax=Caerostris extrusa TaxID=172846 RepID=A0AAV4SMA0_CAEEX|nr:hypothetical protein CEXT_107421 [Caerostris extrusa]
MLDHFMQLLEQNPVLCYIAPGKEDSFCFSVLYQKRLKKEKRSRRRFQEQLEAEVKKRAQYEEALRTTSADTIRLLNDTLSQELERERNSIAESENNGHVQKKYRLSYNVI